MEGGGGETFGGFLPPRPPDAEPALEQRPARPEPPPPERPPPAQPRGPRNAGFPSGAPAAAGGQAPAAWAARPSQPSNGSAVAGLVFSIVSLALLLLTVGLSSLVSLGCGIAGIMLSRTGRRRVESGETTSNAGLAQAGFVTGIVATVLASIATLAWLTIMILALAGALGDDSSGGGRAAPTVIAGGRIACQLVRVVS